MQRSHLAADVLTILRNCLGDRCQHYKFARTRGIPPAECPSITTSWVDRTEAIFGDCDSPNPAYCDDTQETVGLRIAITDVCMGPDSAEQFDWDAEDAIAACFDDDVQAVEDCIRCRPDQAAWAALYRDHGINSIGYEGTTYDVEADGGGYSAYIELTIVAQACCTGP